MRLFSLIKLHKKKVVYIFLLSEVVLISATIFGVFIIQQFYLRGINKNLVTFIDRVKNDLRYEKGKWNISLYNSDPLTPNPSGSSGFLSPLYIITADGFVIERINPINGYLDSSDYLHLLAFDKPQFITTTTNEVWQLLSGPIKNGDEVVGVITVSQYNPPSTNTSEIDKKLQQNLENISSKIKYIDGVINVADVDIRHIHYDVSFEIVSKFNKVILNNGRTPSFIDRSYFKSELEKRGAQKITDSTNGNNFLVLTRVISEPGGNPVGLISAAYPIDTISQTVRDYLILSLTLSIFMSLLLAIITTQVFSNEINLADQVAKDRKSLTENTHNVSFDKKGSTIYLGNKQVTIPYSSNQFYLVEALFSALNKKWEQDELLDKMGIPQDKLNMRKIYDAALAVNRKVGFRLIYHKDKTYYINPQLAIASKKNN